MKPYRMNVSFNGRMQTPKGYLSPNGDIFLCKGDSLTSKTPWYSFKVYNGECIDDYGRSTREKALAMAIHKLGYKLATM